MMPLLTPNFSLPYPSGSDAPCEFAQGWCDFTNAFQDVLDGFTATVDRTNPAIPIAKLELTTPVTVPNPAIVAFDTLVTDTAGWTDFDADPTAITVDRGGYLHFTALAEVTATGALPNTATLSILNAISMQETHVEQAGMTVMGLHLWTMQFNSAITKYQIQVSHSFTANITINRASLAIFWHSDTATP